MKPKVSVCIPVYNVERYIEKCVVSLIDQTYRNIEIIFVNDCTPDCSMNIVQKYAEKDNRIMILEHEQNRGLMRARETGYRAATGDYIMFCDSDDAMPADGIEFLVSSACETGADITSGNAQRFTDTQISDYPFNSLPFGSDPEAVYKALLSKDYSHTLWGKLFKRELFKNHIYLTLDNATNGEDGILFYQVLQYVNKVIHIPQIVYYYRFNTSSATNVRLKASGIYSILVGQQIRRSTCEKYNSLQCLAWEYTSSLINGLYANGYDVDTELNTMLKELHLEEYVDVKQMVRHMPTSKCIKLILIRLLKPHYIKYLIEVRLKKKNKQIQ